jgi:hypothetical protein
MKSRNHKLFQVFTLVLIIVPITNMINNNRAVLAANDGLIIADIAFAGAVEPGSTNLQMTINVLNVNSYDIKGIIGNLSLVYPFRDSTDGDSIAIAQGIASSLYFNVSQYLCLAGEPFDLTYTLNVDEDGLKGFYESQLNVSYFFAHNLTQASQIIPITIKIANQQPILDWFIPTTGTIAADVNETLDFQALGFDPDNDSLTYNWEINDVLMGTGQIFSFTTTTARPATYRLLLIVSDGEDEITQQWTIQVRNQAPEILWSRPTATLLNTEPYESLLFEINANDNDNDSLSYEWSLNDNIVAINQTQYEYTTDDVTPSVHTLSVVVSDGIETIERTWQIQNDIQPVYIIQNKLSVSEAGSVNLLEITVTNNIWNETVIVFSLSLNLL